MKNSFISLFMLAILLLACTSSQKITGVWVNREALPKGPYHSIFILVLSQNADANFMVEYDMASLMATRGRKTVKSSTIFLPNSLSTGSITREQMAKIIKDVGCDAVFTIALLDTKTEEHYQPGTAYYPMSYGYYGSYYGYYNHYYPQIYSPGYYTTDKTFYIETNFYDLASDQLLWSIQSQAYNPAGLESWFKSYSSNLIARLKKEGLITK
jgi:hypothetical protein